MTGDVVLLSGGVDSAFLVAMLRPSACVFVDYGQPAREHEARAALSIATAAESRLFSIEVQNMPLGEMATGMAAQIVPARNLWLTSLAAAFGSRVWIGAAPQDTDYPDCQPEFLRALNHAMSSVGNSLGWMAAPRSVREAALSEIGWLSLTYSCYRGDGPCGKCPSCLQ